MGEITNKIQLKVELIQSLKRKDAESFLDFSYRVTTAAKILKTTITCSCSTVDFQDFVKVLFVAGLEPLEAALCYELSDSHLDKLVSLLSQEFNSVPVSFQTSIDSNIKSQIEEDCSLSKEESSKLNEDIDSECNNYFSDVEEDLKYDQESCNVLYAA